MVAWQVIVTGRAAPKSGNHTPLSGSKPCRITEISGGINYGTSSNRAFLTVNAGCIDLRPPALQVLWLLSGAGSPARLSWLPAWRPRRFRFGRLRCSVYRSSSPVCPIHPDLSDAITADEWTQLGERQITFQFSLHVADCFTIGSEHDSR